MHVRLQLSGILAIFLLSACGGTNEIIKNTRTGGSGSSANLTGGSSASPEGEEWKNYPCAITKLSSKDGHLKIYGFLDQALAAEQVVEMIFIKAKVNDFERTAVFGTGFFPDTKDKKDKSKCADKLQSKLKYGHEKFYFKLSKYNKFKVDIKSSSLKRYSGPSDVLIQVNDQICSLVIDADDKGRYKSKIKGNYKKRKDCEDFEDEGDDDESDLEDDSAYDNDNDKAGANDDNL